MLIKNHFFLFNYFFKNYLFNLFFQNIIFYEKIWHRPVTILNLKQKNIFYFEALSFNNISKSLVLDLLLESDLTNKPYLNSKNNFFNLKTANNKKFNFFTNLKITQNNSYQFLKFTIFKLHKNTKLINLKVLIKKIELTFFFILKNQKSCLYFKLTTFNLNIQNKLIFKKSFFKIKKKMFKKKPKLFYKTHALKKINKNTITFSNFKLRDYYLNKLSAKFNINTNFFYFWEHNPSLNFKYKYNYLYKQIRLFYFFKKIKNKAAIQFFSKINKLNLINFVHSFFNIKMIANFFFITSAQHNFFINNSFFYINGNPNISKNICLKKFDIIQLPISLEILKFLIIAQSFNFLLLSKLLTYMNETYEKSIAIWKRKEILFYQLAIQSWVELDYLTLSCVILNFPKNYNFFKINLLNLFFFKSYTWRT